jgi:hypothetical protein
MKLLGGRHILVNLIVYMIIQAVEDNHGEP